MHIVRFKNGKYAVRSFSFLSLFSKYPSPWKYMDLNDKRHWWSNQEHIYAYCMGSFEQCYKTSLWVFEHGSRKQVEFLQKKTTFKRLACLWCWIMFCEFAIEAMVKVSKGFNWEILLALPAIFLVIRGFYVETKVVFADVGWDK